jgi:hypothetical protein
MIEDNNVKGMVSWERLSLCFSENSGIINQQLYEQLLSGAIEYDKEQFQLKQNSLKNDMGGLNSLKHKHTKLFEFDEVNKMFLATEIKWSKYATNKDETDKKSKFKKIEERILKYTNSNSQSLHQDQKMESLDSNQTNSQFKISKFSNKKFIQKKQKAKSNNKNKKTRFNITKFSDSENESNYQSQFDLNMSKPFKSADYGFTKIFEILSQKTKNPHKDAGESITINNLKNKKITCPVPFSFLKKEKEKPERIRQKKLREYITEQEKKMSLIGKPQHIKKPIPKNFMPIVKKQGKI